MNALAIFLGGVAGLASDPPLFIAAALVGALARRLRTFLLAVVLVGPATHLAISYVVWDYTLQRDATRTYQEVAVSTLVPRLAAFLLVAGAVAGLVWLFRRLTRRRI